MNFLYSLDELLSIRTNGWACTDCGKAWIDMHKGLSAAVEDDRSECAHRVLRRASLIRS